MTWRPISLKIKNDAQPDSPFYDAVVYSHGLLRVLESVRATEGDGPLEELLAEAGLDPTHAAAFDDESWDAVINASASSDP